MGLGKLTLRCDQGATFRVRVRWRQPLMDPLSGDPIIDSDGNVLSGPPMSLTGYTGRMHVRKTIAATEFDLDLTTANGGVSIVQPFGFVLGWCRLATVTDHPLTGLDDLVDGVAPNAGDRILVKAQTAAGDNGVYVADDATWVRAPDADQPADLSQGCCVWVREGVRYDDTTWRQGQALSSFGDAQTWAQDDTIGVFELFASAERTEDLTTSGVYDVEMISPSGDDVTRVLEGKFRLSKEVTRT